ELAQISGLDEVLALVEKGLHRLRRALAGATENVAPGLAGEIRVLFGSGECELLLDDLACEHEPRVVVTGRAQVVERAQSVEAGKQRHRQPATGCVEPQ